MHKYFKIQNKNKNITEGSSVFFPNMEWIYHLSALYQQLHQFCHLLLC